jgi:hypothetical protein
VLSRMESQFGKRALAPLVALAGLLLPALVAEAHPPAPYAVNGRPVRGNYHRWLHSAKVPLVKGRIMLIRRGCPGRPRFVGCVFTRHPKRIYLRPGARAPRAVFYHELGHTFDMRVLRHRDRRAFRRIMHMGRPAWWAGPEAPVELFAEGYGACARLGLKRRPRSHSIYGYRPTLKQHRAVCKLIIRRGRPTKKRRKPQPAPKPPPVIAEPPRPAPPAPGEQPKPPPPEQDQDGDGVLDWLLPPLGSVKLL